MSVTDWASVVVAICTITGALLAALQWLIKHYLAELKPNGGGSMNDRLVRVERQIEQIYEHLLKQ